MLNDPLLRAIDRVIDKKRKEVQPRQGEQVITGATGTQAYAIVRSCHRRREKLSFQNVIYRVRWVQVKDGRFRAGVVACQ